MKSLSIDRKTPFISIVLDLPIWSGDQRSDKVDLLVAELDGDIFSTSFSSKGMPHLLDKELLVHAIHKTALELIRSISGGVESKPPFKVKISNNELTTIFQDLTGDGLFQELIDAVDRLDGCRIKIETTNEYGHPETHFIGFFQHSKIERRDNDVSISFVFTSSILPIILRMQELILAT